ncbi:MAG: Melibiose carrier protein [Firmicutes bacterium ADurb.Bin182]|nr:MAG: Melibiose carrier protein [Firmicutes bacterium ADurb.Bin182]
MGKNYFKRNLFSFGLGTIGRDMLYSLVSIQLIFYLTDILQLDDRAMWWITGILLVFRIYDAVDDPIMGTLVDNTKSKWGKFKPNMLIGALLSGLFTILLFTDFKLTGAAYIVTFSIVYLLWGITFTINDIAYWSMLPTLSMDQKEREKIGAFARICANAGLFTVVVLVVPMTNIIGGAVGSMKTGYFLFSIAVVLMMWGTQSITLFGVKEPHLVVKESSTTSIKDMARAIFKNDQLLYTAVSMALFMIGYSTTTSFGLYFFKYAYGDENMYPVFAAILGASQIAALAMFPLFSRKFSRKQLYTGATILVVAGYLLFYFSPYDTMAGIGVSGMLIFIGETIIELLMLVFLSDTIEYGQWKLKKRNDSVTFAVQPFINKMGAAVGSGIVSATVIISGINSAETAADVTAQGLLIMKFSMLVLPLLFIVAGYVINRLKYKIDKQMYEKILGDLRERGEIR